MMLPFVGLTYSGIFRTVAAAPGAFAAVVFGGTVAAAVRYVFLPLTITAFGAGAGKRAW